MNKGHIVLKKYSFFGESRTIYGFEGSDFHGNYIAFSAADIPSADICGKFLSCDGNTYLIQETTYTDFEDGTKLLIAYY